jgi:hypothetical protein
MLQVECDVILTPATAETAPLVPLNSFTGDFVVYFVTSTEHSRSFHPHFFCLQDNST